MGVDMPYYAPLRHLKNRERIVTGLQRLREEIRSSGVPDRQTNSNLLLASWNLREFESASWGKRTPDAYYFIAEIIDHFDLVAVQEVRGLGGLRELTRRLGPYWDFVVTDTTLGQRGNHERLAYMFDTRRVRLSGLVGEVVIPPDSKAAAVQLARTPLVCGFQAGWAKLQLTTVHILWGTDQVNDPERVEEIRSLAKLLAKRAEDRAEIDDDNLILLGDFNIFGPESMTMKALTDFGWCIPDAIKKIRGTNVTKDPKKYDQIAFRERKNRLQFTDRAGTVAFFNAVFRDEDEAAYETERSEGRDTPYNFKRWRTYQMSDHQPLWVELDIDFADEYLDELLVVPPSP
jgi:endonuclease/exonuclease/phosphatase family metal-dependent hydrolase